MEVSVGSVLRVWLSLVTAWSALPASAHPARPERAHRDSRAVELVAIDTELGKVEGYRESVLDKDLDIFLGVPYAKPPVGDRRFQRPSMVEPWEGTIDATSQPSTCSQIIDTSFDQFAGVEMWNPNTNISEDCLYLNIWTPTERLYGGKTRAVMVWIFGGSFTLGSNTLDVYDGRILAAEGDVVVVSMQYRIGPMGFLYLGLPDAPGNMGLLDQQLALRWVYDYIEAFGGDRNRITVFGESAGAVSASFHLISPLSQPYIRSSIMQSGSALCPWAVASNETALERSLELAKLVGCSSGSNEDILACLREVPASKLSEDIWAIPDRLRDIIAPISPIVDGYFLQEHPLDTIEKGEAKDANILLGVNKDEGNYFLVYNFGTYYNISYPERTMRKLEFQEAAESFLDALPESVIDAVTFEYGVPSKWKQGPRLKDAMDDLLGDYSFKCAVIDFARLYAKHNQGVYLYNFVHRTSVNPWPEWLGTMHGYEIDHVFGAPLNTSRPYKTEEKALSTKMVKYWTNFAKTNNPNLDEDNVATDITWPEFTLDMPRHLVLNTTEPMAAVDMGLRHRPCTLWREVVPKLKKSIGNPGHSTCGASGVSLSQWAAALLITLHLVLYSLLLHTAHS